MPPPATLSAFAVTSIALLIIPGPVVLFIVARSGAQGTRAGLVSVLGVHSGSVVHVLAAVAGLSAVLVASSLAFTTVKVAGGAYLIYLGVKSLRRARHAELVVAPILRPMRRLFAEGFVVNLLNPKVALFFLAFLPQFVERGSGPIWSQMLALGVMYIALGVICDGTYALVAARVGRWVNHRARVFRTGRYAEGGLLLGLGALALALPHQRSAK